MFRRPRVETRREHGYSLVEVLAAIVILTVAIIPMVKMFDAGLQAATLGSNYDGARSLAKKQIETVQTRNYNQVRSSMPNAPCTFDATGLCNSLNRTDPDSSFDSYRYDIRKQYVVPDASGTGFINDNESTGLMKVTVTVRWGGSLYKQRAYTSTILKAR